MNKGTSDRTQGVTVYCDGELETLALAKMIHLSTPDLPKYLCVETVVRLCCGMHFKGRRLNRLFVNHFAVAYD